MLLTATLSTLLLLTAAGNVQAAVTFQTNLIVTGLYTNSFSTFAIVNFPPCQYSGQGATLTITSTALKTPMYVNSTVPQCRTRRDSGAVVLSGSSSGNTLITNVGVRVENLSPNTTYFASYSIVGSTDTGSSTNFTTLSVQNYTSIPDTMQRSGGMVVITVLLSIAMVILILGLVGTLVIGGGKS